jgi:hypothetical protein
MKNCGESFFALIGAVHPGAREKEKRDNLRTGDETEWLPIRYIRGMSVSHPSHQ